VVLSVQNQLRVVITGDVLCAAWAEFLNFIPNGFVLQSVNLLAPELFFLILAHPVYVNNTGTKKVRIMKQTAF
jgi:hypothetical protein